MRGILFDARGGNADPKEKFPAMSELVEVAAATSIISEG